ncbi:hypothetical protein [Permianibacter aggregans]|uniref:HEPN AbiU2-like domain-containing protein n=1 Tax=Permianibacter aggregans TaxID=1510150 RepID=A0A4R6UJT8_9GAMM|nr:hypothetical protein [Permianibacter aggregans]QGX38465.1 hypothetical protein E2H98_01800 [Permianibacter aggregans]TDQ45583.1 hypothetical protein EV696_11951 [Permianibacter aggregans]
MDAKKLTSNRLFLAFKDMEDVERYLHAYSELEGLDEERQNSYYFDHREALFLAAIVTYCRSFKKSNSTGMADKRINVDSIGLFDSELKLKELHERIISLRDQAVAHADWSFHSTEIVEANNMSVLRRSPRPYYSQGISVSEFLKLAAHVSGKCKNLSFDFDRNISADTEQQK